MSTTKPAPAWFRQFTASFMAGEAHAFILHGDINGYAHEGVTQRGLLLASLSSKRDVVAVFSLGRGITFPVPSMRDAAMRLLGMEGGSAQAANPLTAALAAVNGGESDDDDPFGGARRPTTALELLERLMLAGGAKGKVAVILDGADLISAHLSVGKGAMSPDDRTVLSTLRYWATDRDIAGSDNPIFLFSRDLADVHADLREATSGYKAIELAMPKRDQRVAFVEWYLVNRVEEGQPIALDGITTDEIGTLTAGLSLRHIEDILLLGAQSGVSRELVKARKDAIIASDYTEVAEMIEPIPDEMFGGQQRLRLWAQDEVIDPLRQGRVNDAPKGFLLVGPPGGGKCITGDSVIVTNKGLMALQDVPRYFHVNPLTNEVSGLVVQSVTPNGETVQAVASHWWDMGVQDTYKLVTDAGLTIEGTHEHPLLVVCPDGRFEWKQLHDIQIGEWVVVKQGHGMYGYDSTIDAETAYIFGLLVGDGHLATGGHIRLTSADAELVEAFSSYIEQRYRDIPMLHKGQAKVKKVGQYDYSVQAWPIKADMIRKGLSVALSFEKSVPTTVLQASAEIQAAFLQGLFDADGSFSEHIAEYGTSSVELGRQVSAMLWNFGIAHTIGWRQRFDGGRASLRIQISGDSLVAFAELIGFRLTRKVERMRKYLNRSNPEAGKNTRDRIPHHTNLIRQALDEFAPCWSAEGGIRGSMYKAARPGRESITRDTLARIVKYGEALGVASEALAQLGRTLRGGLYFTKITAKTEGRARVFDLTVPGTHSFVANSIVNHNTFFIRWLAGQLGFNAVALRSENILGGIVGESERKLKTFFGFVRSLAPCLVFMDELDQSDMSRRGNGSGNPVASNLFNQMLQFMSDETLRGKVVVAFASNRPDLIDDALLRFGRVDAVIPVLLPDETERGAIIAAQARSQGASITDRAVASLAAATNKYSAADLGGVIRKARTLARREGSTAITPELAARAMSLIRPNSPGKADYYTLLAVNACNDAELLPPEYAGLLADRAALQAQIAAAAPEQAQAPKAEGPRRSREF